MKKNKLNLQPLADLLFENQLQLRNNDLSCSSKDSDDRLASLEKTLRRICIIRLADDEKTCGLLYFKYTPIFGSDIWFRMTWMTWNPILVHMCFRMTWNPIFGLPEDRLARSIQPLRTSFTHWNNPQLRVKTSMLGETHIIVWLVYIPGYSYIMGDLRPHLIFLLTSPLKSPLSNLNSHFSCWNL